MYLGYNKEKRNKYSVFLEILLISAKMSSNIECKIKIVRNFGQTFLFRKTGHSTLPGGEPLFNESSKSLLQLDFLIKFVFLKYVQAKNVTRVVFSCLSKYF